MVNIRTFQTTDAAAVRQLFARGQLDFAAGFEEAVKAYIRRSLADDLADIPRHYLNESGSGFWVADIRGQVKGMVGVQRRSEEAAELRRMSVAADARRSGIGGMLLETVEAFCRARGYRRITLSTVTHLRPAIAMYRKFGYRLVDAESYGVMTVQYFVKHLADPPVNLMDEQSSTRVHPGP